MTALNYPDRGDGGGLTYQYIQFAIRIYARLYPNINNSQFSNWYRDLTDEQTHIVPEDLVTTDGDNRPHYRSMVQQVTARMNINSSFHPFLCLIGSGGNFTVHPDYIQEILEQTTDYVEEVPAEEDEPPVYQQQGTLGGFANSHSVVAPIGVDQESDEWFAQIAENNNPTQEIEQLEQEDPDQRGVVYIMHNPAWPGWVVTGKAKQLSRMRSYQTACPFRDFQTIGHARVEERGVSETQLQNLLNTQATQRGAASTNGRLSEWFEIDPEQAYALLQEQHGDNVSQGDYFEN